MMIIPFRNGTCFVVLDDERLTQLKDLIVGYATPSEASLIFDEFGLPPHQQKMTQKMIERGWKQ